MFQLALLPGRRGPICSMSTADRIYQRTEAGEKAWESRDPGVPAEQRRILGLINGETHSDLLQNCLRHYSAAQIAGWLGQLEAQGVLHSVPGATEQDLDFTGNSTAADLRGVHPQGEEKNPPR